MYILILYVRKIFLLIIKIHVTNICNVKFVGTSICKTHLNNSLSNYFKIRFYFIYYYLLFKLIHYSALLSPQPVFFYLP